MIRQACAHDLPALVALGRRMHAESRYHVLRFSPDRLRSTLQQVLSAPLGFCRVVESRGEIVGGLAAFAAPHWASEDMVATDLSLFVTPEARGGIAAALLVKQYRAWARGHGVKLIDLGVTTGVRTEETAQLFEKLGARRIGYVLEF